MPIIYTEYLTLAYPHTHSLLQFFRYALIIPLRVDLSTPRLSLSTSNLHSRVRVNDTTAIMSKAAVKPQVLPIDKKLEKYFNHNDHVKFVRLQWVDYSGVLRTQNIPKERCIQLASGSNHYSLAQNCMIVPISTAPRFFPDVPEA